MIDGSTLELVRVIFSISSFPVWFLLTVLSYFYIRTQNSRYVRVSGSLILFLMNIVGAQFTLTALRPYVHHPDFDYVVTTTGISARLVFLIVGIGLCWSTWHLLREKRHGRSEK